jgi:hypothetical protein
MTDGEASADERDSKEADERDGDADEELPGDERGDDSPHLDGVEDGAGCTEIWERLSERREE